MMVLASYPDLLPSAGRAPSRIAALSEYLTSSFPAAAAIHLLPFNPSCGDGGFSSTSWVDVDPALGTWADVADLASRRHLFVDVVYNHVGVEHPLFARFLDDPESNAALLYAYRYADGLSCPLSPRGGPVLREWTIRGEAWLLWQTYTDTAVDIRIDHPEILRLIREHLALLRQHGIKGVRIDAPAYFGKILGGPVRHNRESYRLARLVGHEVRDAGLDMIAQLGCDEAALEYFPPSEGWQVPVVDLAFPAHLALAILSGDVRHLADHLRATWSLPNVLLRAPRTHDGILLQSSYFSSRARDLLVQHARTFGIEDRAISGEPYELNASLPHLYTAGVGTAPGRDARIQLAAAVATFAPGIPYLYLPALLGYEPEAYYGRDADPRGLNRRPLREDVATSIIESAHARCVADLTGQLAALDLPPKSAPAGGAEPVQYVETSGLLIERRERGVALLANFSREGGLRIPRSLSGRVRFGHGVRGDALEPLGFAVVDLSK